MSPIIFWMVCFLCIATLTEGVRILAIISIPSYSHQIPYRALWAELSQRHEIVLLTSDPIDDPNLTNLTEIDFRFNYKLFRNLNFVKKRYTDSWISTVHKYFWKTSEQLSESIYEHPEVRKLYAPDSGEKFDLLIAEILTTPAIYALAYRFNTPIIGVSSLGLYANNYYLLGAPVLPSHPSTWEMEQKTGFNLSLWRRTMNFIQLWYHIYLVMNKFMPQQQVIAEKYLGKNIPDIRDLERNISIVFVNQLEIVTFVRPKPPNIMTFGSLHLSKKPEALPKNIKEFLDDAPNGFIYVSLGTNVAMSSFPKQTQDVFRDVFASLPCKVLWKFDGKLTDKPDNIYIADWFPQQSILAHPKIRLFVYQGGLQSTEEAVHYAVPLVGLPILADQNNQINKMVSLGVAIGLDIVYITKEALNESIMEILNNKSYKERMLSVKLLNEDKPYDLLQNAIWWIEFIIRHKDAPHLRTSIAYDSWYQKYDMDIIAILSVTAFVTLLCALLIMYKLLKIICKCYAKTLTDPKKKIN